MSKKGKAAKAANTAQNATGAGPEAAGTPTGATEETPTSAATDASSAQDTTSAPQWNAGDVDRRVEEQRKATQAAPSNMERRKQDRRGAPEQDIGDIGKNSKGNKRGPQGPRTGDAEGAKPMVRRLLGTKGDDGVYPAMSVEELCAATKKSDVNIRTILSDLRSAKYCGAGGVFMTHAIKEAGVTKYRFGEKEPVAEPSPAAV